MSFHRFVVTVEVTVAAPGASGEPATPVDPNNPDDQELTASLTDALDKATAKKVKGRRKGKDYIVEKVEKV